MFSSEVWKFTKWIKYMNIPTKFYMVVTSQLPLLIMANFSPLYIFLCTLIHFVVIQFIQSKSDKYLYPRPTKLEGWDGGWGVGVYWIHLVRLSVRLSVDDMVSGALVKFALEFQFQISYACWWWQKPIDFQRCHFQNGRLAAILDFLVSGLWLYFGFEYQLQT